ncbi:MAG TPA: hypothetical protein VF549_12150 [Solirubrobacteraceae bacterium]
MDVEDPDEHAIGYQVLPRGTPVFAADGVQVGTFDKALHHGREHLFDGIVVKTGDRKRFVDAPEVERITNKRIRLTISSAEVAEQPEHRGVLGPLQERAKHRSRRIKRRFRR